MTDAVLARDEGKEDLTATRLIGAALLELLGSLWRAPLVWIALIIVATATDVVDLVYSPPKGLTISGLMIASLAVRILGVTWVFVAAIRAYLRSPVPRWAVDRGTLFYLGWGLFLLVGANAISFGLTTGANAALAHVSGAALSIDERLALTALGVPLLDLILLRIIPWATGRAGRMPGVTLRGVWRGMRGSVSAFTGAYLVLVVPLYAAHFALTAWLQRGGMAKPLLLSWTVVDGVESAVMAMLMLALYATVFKRLRFTAG